MYLHIGNCIILKDLKISRIDNISPDLTIDDFKSKVAEKINFIKENIELFFSGKILKDSTTLKENGIEEGFVVNVLQKKEKETPVLPPVSPEDIKALVRAFQILDKRNAQRHVLQKLKKNDVLESIISTTPGLIDDDAAIVILQHPELMSKLGDVKAVKRLIKEHPSLATVARNLVAAVQNDTRPSPMASTSTFTSPLNTAFNVGSDDEDMEPMGNDDSQNRTLDTSEEEERQPFNLVAQVAAALASGALTNRTPSAGTSSSGITPEMMSAAVQQAMASTNPEIPQQSSSATTSQPNTDEVVTLAKLDQLRRLGLVNDAINIQALQLSNGDVETAVNLILGGLQDDS